MTSTTGVRADGARTRERVLAAARAELTRHGPDVGMDQIAAAAGVAVGTLYRHFPSKADLIATALAARTVRLVDSLQRAADRARAGGRVVEEITAVLGDLVDVIEADRALRAAAAALGVTGEDQAEKRRGRAAMEDLIAYGQAAGELRPDVTVADLRLLLTTMPGNEIDTQARRRWLELMLRGLTATGEGPAGRTGPDRRSGQDPADRG